MGILLCQACVFSILQTSLVLSAVQLICWPLDWVGLRRVRIAVTHVYAHAMGQSFVLWMEHIVGSTIVVTGDVLPPHERVLAVCNHVNSEWMHLVGLCGRYTSTGGFKAVMKEALKYVPIANVGIREGFITVKRGQGKAARQSILDSFRDQGARLCRDRVPMWLVLFPEGTWIVPGADGAKIQRKSNEYAHKAGYAAPLRNVLFPRAHGFVALLEGMRHGPDRIDAVYDITVAYNKPYHPVRIGTASPPSVVQLCSGKAGSAAPDREVHFHVTRHPISGMPAGGAAARWLCQRFAVEKEKLLDHFEEHRVFPGPVRNKGGAEARDGSSVAVLCLQHAFLIAHSMLLYWALFALFGWISVVVLLGASVLAALAAATGDNMGDKTVVKRLEEKEKEKKKKSL
jgi:1-acyl-sn-glycerol-3-phosphate acyltransferase